MKKKVIKYALSILALFFIAYHSIYFKKLDEIKLASASKGFDASGYAHDFYNTRLLPHLDSAIELSSLLSLLKTEPDKAFNDYSHALAIGNIRYFLVQGQGVVTSIGDDETVVALKNDSSQTVVKIATEFVYGNAIRDASGLLSPTGFASTADLNNVSEELNKIVRQVTLPPFKAMVKQGNVVNFWGVIELNQAHTNLDSIELTPIRLGIIRK